MVISLQELQIYKNFDELANDVLDLAKEILPEKLLYLTAMNDSQQIILKLSDDDTSILITEGMVINLNETVCSRIDFESREPLVFEDTADKKCPDDLRTTLEQANIKSYLGIPISLVNGDKFGTLCVAHHEQSHFDKKSISLLQRIARMFSYYLDLERFAYRDSLTGLYNRHYFTKIFEDHAEKHKNHVKTEGTLFFLDLDGFKNVNDIYGHETGDFVLKEVAERLQKFVSNHSDAFVVRLGGDEFVITFSGALNRDEISRYAEQVLHCLSEWDAKYEVSASIGIITYPDKNDINLNSLLKDADAALYRAKKAGKNTYRFH